jgi:uncharacterized protein YggE
VDKHRFRRGLSTLAIVATAGALTLTGLSGGRVAAQDDASPVAGGAVFGPGTISVNGHGSVDVTPDTAQVTIGVDVTLPTLEEAEAESTSQANAIIEAVKAGGVADEDVQTSNYSVYVVRNYDENGNPAEIMGYQISNQVNVTIRDIDTVGDILSAAIDAGANNIWGISFYVDDTTAAASEARVLAVEDARRKAEELAAAADLSLGRIVAIAEGSQGAILPPMYQRAGGGEMAMDAAAAPIEPGSTEVTVDVQIVFEIE